MSPEPWGDIPGWIEAVGTLLAFGFAVFLYGMSVRDQRQAQARLLAPVGGAVPVECPPGTICENNSVARGIRVVRPPGAQPALAETALSAKVRLVSTSDETFSGIEVALVPDAGEPVAFTIDEEIAPHATNTCTNYYPPGTIAGHLQVRVRFTDANGRRWERTNGKPLKRRRDPGPLRRLAGRRRRITPTTP